MNGEQREFDALVDTEELATLLRLMGEKADPAILNLLLKEGAGFLGRIGSSEAPPAGDVNWQYPVINREIPDNSSILDLGCGDGDLLSWLSKGKNARVQGVELDSDKVARCVERGIPVIQTDLDLGLKVFPDKAFDYVILEETLQTLRHPDIIISEMRRVGRRGIVSFPNFGYWRVRLDLAVRGRMPMSGWLPHRWYCTPNIHLFTIRDFIDFAGETGMKLIAVHVLEGGATRHFGKGDNLYAEEAMVFFE